LKRRRFRNLELLAKYHIDTFSTGSHLSLLKDKLMDIDTVREYQPGDKKLDSKSSIKTGKIMSRVFNPEKSMNVFILLDYSSSQMTKHDAPLVSSLYIAYLADILYDKVGILIFDDEVISFSEPTDDQTIVVDLLRDIYEKDVLCKATNINVALSKVRTLELTNTLFVLISDFCYDISDKDLRILKQISMGKNNFSISLVLFNEFEWIFKDCGFDFDFCDLETDTHLEWSSEKNEDHKVTFNNWQRDLKSKLRKVRVEPIFLEVNNERFLMPFIRYISRGQ